MKKILCLISALILLVTSLAACDLQSNDTDNKNFDSYDSIIELYQTIAENAIQYTPQKYIDGIHLKKDRHTEKKEQDLFDLLFDSCIAFRSKKDRLYGYSISDINDDGTEELLLMLEDHTLIAVFSMCDGMPTLLDSFNSNYSGYLSAAGLICISEVITPTTTAQRVYRISAQCDKLEQLGEIGTEHFDLERRTGCYKIVDNEKISISEKEYNELYHAIFKAQPLWDEIDLQENTEIQFIPLILPDCKPDAYNAFFTEFIENNPIDRYYNDAISEGVVPPQTVSINWARYWSNEFELTLNQMDVLFENRADYIEWREKMIAWREVLRNESRADSESLTGTLPRGELNYLYGKMIRRKVIELKYDLCTAEHTDQKQYLAWYGYIE